MQFLLNYSYWLLIFCPLAGILYAAAFYYRQRLVPDLQGDRKWLAYLLAFFRFTAITLIAFLLLNPFLKRSLQRTEKPRVVILQDVSTSVFQFWKKEDSVSYLNQLFTLRDKIGEQCDVQLLGFGEKLHEDGSLNFHDKVTRLSEAMDEVYERNYNTQFGALIIASDGIYNRGINPLYAKAAEAFPIYTIAMGDTIPRSDLRIAGVYNNQVVYLKDKFIVKVDVGAINMEGKQVNISIDQVLGKGSLRKISSANMPVSKNDFIQSHEFVLEAGSTGLQHYRISLAKVEGEFTTDNNVQDLFVEVLDGRQKILIIADGPHPDLGVMKRCIEGNRNYSVDIRYSEDAIEDLSVYNLVILHNLPSTKNKVSSLISQLHEKAISVLYVFGDGTVARDLNMVQQILQVPAGRSGSNDVQAFFNRDFSLYTLSDHCIKTLERFPPLSSPYGDYTSEAQANIVLFQKLGSVSTDFPLLAIGQQLDQKIGVLAGDGLWRWRLFDFEMNKNFDAFDELFNKTVQWLAVKADNRKFRVNPLHHIFAETESVQFEAQLYNDNYETVNEPDANILLTDEEGHEFPFVFSRSGRSYQLNAGYLAVGTYAYSASTSFNGKSYVESGKISISPIQAEALETRADHNLLYQLAHLHGGEMRYPSTMQSIAELLKQRGDLKPVIYESKRTEPLINWKWIFGVILCFLIVEWFMRKYFGGY